MSEARLPDRFAELEPFLARWAVSGTAERARLRGASEADERARFFAAAGPRLDEALDHLDRMALRELPGPERRLMDLMLSLAHVAVAVEVQGEGEAALAPWRERMRIVRSPADA